MQNRLTNATDGATNVEFWYDGLNRQITRRINGSIIIRSVWDGWNLIEEHDQNDSPLEYYIHGARTDELVVRFGGAYGDTWYAQDGRGNTSHLFDYSGLVERYTYGLAGAPQVFDGNGTPRPESSLANRFMFQGREYLTELGIYDYRHRMYHPGLGRFLQSDPLGFGGGDANLFRYCGGDPVNEGDPDGLSGVLLISANYGPGASYTGHSWLTFVSDQTGTVTSFDNMPFVGVRTNPSDYGGTLGNAWTGAWINDASEARLFNYIHNMQSFGPLEWMEFSGWISNCVTFVNGAWRAAGQQPLTVNGHAPVTVGELVTAIIQLNGGISVGYDLSKAINDAANKVLESMKNAGATMGFVMVRDGARKTVVPLSLGGFHYTSGFTVSPGALSGKALATWTQNMIGVPGGGGLPGEGSQPVSLELR